jgi:hypothetical protein
MGLFDGKVAIVTGAGRGKAALLSKSDGSMPPFFFPSP